MKKVLIYIAIILAVLIIAGITTCTVISKDLPQGKDSPETEKMVSQMWEALNKSAWDSTRYVMWSFRGANHYKWDKESNLAEIKWDNNRVLLDPDNISGIAYENDKKVDEASAQNLIDNAWSKWCNDMFWLTAPFKVMDPGTELTLVEHEEGDRLKVTYMDGGVTPGDSYIWVFDNDGMPKAYEMYVEILPVKGVYVPWQDWVTLSTGAKLSSKHEIAGAALELENIKGGMDLNDINEDSDIWEEIR